ncbi:MAG: BatA and WFA domain-containing protein [Fimbriimonadales bacterium]|nr:BatA and WFA domain-containing protein [Fimbriimonadales bacterium]
MLFQSLGVLFWFLPVAGFIILLYLLKIRRREVRVPARFLWPPITTDVRANALFQRLRPNLLLFLQLLIALLLLLALARPAMQARGALGRQTVVIVDASASMGATDVSPSRFEAARRRLRTLIREMSASEQLAIIEAGPNVRVVASLTADQRKLHDAVNSLQLSDARGNIDEALRLAAALVGNRAGSRIVLLSDGAFPEVTDFSPGKAQLVYESLGQHSENVALTAMDVQERAGGIEWFVGLRNFGEKPAKGILEFYAGGELVDAREITIPAKGATGQTLTLPRVREPLEARLVLNDALTSDNRAYLLGATEQTVRVLLVGEGNFFLERALALEPNVQLDKSPTVPESERGNTAGGGNYDLIIFDGTPIVPVKARAVMVIRSKGGPIAELGGAIKLPRVATWERDHPLLRYVEMGNLLIDSAPRLSPAPWAKVLAESQQTPLIVAGEQAGRKWIGIGWDLLESDFPLQPGFPIFIANVLRWATSGRTSQAGFTVRTGTPFTLTTHPDEQQLTLKTPDGQSQTLRVNEGSLIVPGAPKVGLYEAVGRRTRLKFAANLLDSDESNIAPRMSLQLGGRTVTAQSNIFTLRELWRPLALLALLTLLIEWWVFIKRS